MLPQNQLLKMPSAPHYTKVQATSINFTKLVIIIVMSDSKSSEVKFLRFKKRDAFLLLRYLPILLNLQLYTL